MWAPPRPLFGLALVHCALLALGSGGARTHSHSRTPGGHFETVPNDKTKGTPGGLDALDSADYELPREPAGRGLDLIDQLDNVDSDEFQAERQAAKEVRYNFWEKYRRLKDQLDSLLLRKDSRAKGSREGRKFPLSPVILVPGYAGSRLEAKRKRTDTKHFLCDRVSHWKNIWLEPKLMLPPLIKCLIDDLRLDFDRATNRTRNMQGIEIRVSQPDDVASVEHLADIHLPGLDYFASIVWDLTRELGYRRNHNLRGAPYDFRKAPNELGDFFAKLKRDSEQLYESFSGRRVTYICHSMGCNNILYFLQRESREWKDRHVLRVISLAAPWGGSLRAVEATLFGDDLRLPYLLNKAQVKLFMESAPSTMFLYPKERVFGDAPLVSYFEAEATPASPQNSSAAKQQSGAQVIGAADFGRLFEKIKHPSGHLMWLNTRNLLGQLEAPQVELWCLYGRGRPTLNRLDFAGHLADSAAQSAFADGDDRVTVQSGAFCKQWASEQSQPVHVKPLRASHRGIMRHTGALQAIKSILSTGAAVGDSRQPDAL